MTDKRPPKLPWGYAEHNGPAAWGNVTEVAKGKHQSPINIEPSQATYAENLKDSPLKIKYDPSKTVKIFNTGSSVQVLYNSSGSSLSGGPLKDEHKVLQLHFHWGTASDRGSEHTVDGHAYSAEAHIVHWNSDKYADVATAVKSPGGLCVLGIFIKTGAEHSGLKKLTDVLPELLRVGSEVSDGFQFDPTCILPDDITQYWNYTGSLTTPPCYESVNWIVFKETIEMSEAQFAPFRDLRTIRTGSVTPQDELRGFMWDNYRPTMELNDRILYASFQ